MACQMDFVLTEDGGCRVLSVEFRDPAIGASSPGLRR